VGARSASALTFTTFTGQGSWALVDNGAVGSLESIGLFFDPTGYTDIPGGNTDFINSVAVKVSNALGSGGSVSSTAPGTWTFVPGGLSNGGCNGVLDGFACAQDGTTALVTSSWSWTFLLNLNGNALLTGTGGASIKAQFMDHPGQNGHILSQGITLQTVPDRGSTIALLGWALFAFGLLRRKRSKS